MGCLMCKCCKHCNWCCKCCLKFFRTDAGCCCGRCCVEEVEEEKFVWASLRDKGEAEAKAAAAAARGRAAVSRLNSLSRLGFDKAGGGNFVPFSAHHPDIFLEEGGVVAVMGKDKKHGTAVAAQPVMWSGVHRARFTVLERARFSLTVGVVHAGTNDAFDATHGGWCSPSGVAWAWHTSGVCSHKGYHAWEGMQDFKKGDYVDLCLDLDSGTLTASKNGKELGTLASGVSGAAGGGRWGAGFCWMVELFDEGDSVKLESIPDGGAGRPLLAPLPAPPASTARVPPSMPKPKPTFGSSGALAMLASAPLNGP
jgi:hypothetical protein